MKCGPSSVRFRGLPPKSQHSIVIGGESIAMTLVHVYMDRKLLKELDAKVKSYTGDNRPSRNELIRQACRAYLEGQE